MSCQQSNVFGPAVVWSSKSTSTWRSFPLGPAQETNGAKLFRPSVELGNDTGCKVRPEIQTSNDGSTWSASTAVGSLEVTAEGLTVNDGYLDMASTIVGKLYWRPCVGVANESGTELEFCHAAVRFDVKGV